MGLKRTDEFRKDAVRIALTSGLARRQVADDLGVGMSTLNKWIAILFADYQKILRQHGFKVSMSDKGNCYDNAAVETFFKTIKAELIWRHPWETRRKAEMAIFKYINGFYNPRRRHSALGWKSPVTFERKVA